MLVVITYDINTETPVGRKRLSRIAKICCNYGQRVQNSVFECDLNPTQLVVIKSQLLDIIRVQEDSLRFYYLGNNYHKKIEQFGAKVAYDPEEPLVL